jgi:Homeodomain-like domain
MEFAAAAVVRAMTYQQVIMRALAGTWTWLKAADVLDIHPRSLRRWRARYETPCVNPPPVEESRAAGQLGGA